MNAPEAKANEPALTGVPRKTQGLGPSHCSFCRTVSKVVRSGVTVVVVTQPD